jgi:outer membrane protein OmpA-like peptidoglycan-associated protein
MVGRWLTLVVLLVLAGCGLPDNVVVLIPDDDGLVGKVTVSNAAGQVRLDQPMQGTGLESGAAPTQPFIVSQTDFADAFARTMSALPEKPLVFIIYFRLDAAEIAPESGSALASAIAAAKVRRNADVSVIGHTDASGSEAYNLALSLRRAETVRGALTAAGIPASIIDVAYHGANDPLIPTASGAIEPRNRRVEVTIR